jgi:hypothetical protein
MTRRWWAVFQAMSSWRLWTGGGGFELGEVGVEAGLELVQEELELGAVPRAPGGDLDVDEFGPGGAQGRVGALADGVGDGVVAHGLAQDAEALAAEGVGVEAGAVVDGAVGHGGEEEGGVADGAGHGPGAVLGVGDRDDAALGDEADGGLEADEAVDGGGAEDAAVGLGADADEGEAGRDRGAGAGARAAGVVVEGVGVAGEAAAAAPAGGGAWGAEVGPLAEVGLAEDDDAGLAQVGDEGGVDERAVIGEGEGAGGGDEAADVDVVLDHDRDAVEGAADVACGAFAVEAGGVGEGVGV